MKYGDTSLATICEIIYKIPHKLVKLCLYKANFKNDISVKPSDQSLASSFACFKALLHGGSQFVSQQKWVEVAILRR